MNRARVGVGTFCLKQGTLSDNGRGPARTDVRGNREHERSPTHPVIAPNPLAEQAGIDDVGRGERDLVNLAIFPAKIAGGPFRDCANVFAQETVYRGQRGETIASSPAGNPTFRVSRASSHHSLFSLKSPTVLADPLHTGNLPVSSPYVFFGANRVSSPCLFLHYIQCARLESRFHSKEIA